MHSLPVFIRLEGETVLLLGEGDMADAKQRLLERAGAVVTDDPVALARLAFVAMDDAREAAAVAGQLKAKGLLVNVADQPGLCDFTLPAIVDRDPVIIAIGTGGYSAGLAKALRQRFEDWVPASIGVLARRLYDGRPIMKARWPGAAERRRAIDAGLAPGGVIDALDGASSSRFDSFLDSAMPAGETVTHLVIASDDPDELTLRAARLLGQADEVWHLPSIAPAILHRARADARRVSSMTPPSPGAASGGKTIVWLTQM